MASSYGGGVSASRTTDSNYAGFGSIALYLRVVLIRSGQNQRVQELAALPLLPLRRSLFLGAPLGRNHALSLL